jgi:hypothetical protein
MVNGMTTDTMTHEEMDREVDLAVAGSFPASDPPPWTLGATTSTSPLPRPPSPARLAPAAIDVVISAGRGRRRTAALVEALVLTALIPVGVFVAAAPFLLAVWAFGAVAAWLLSGR